MTAAIEPQHVTDAFIAMLEAATAMAVGDHEAPPDRTLPYLIVYRIDGGGFSGPAWDDSTADATYVFQVTAVGEARVQAEALAGRVRSRILSRDADGRWDFPLALPAPYKEMSRGPDASPAGPDRVGTLWHVPDRYQITVTP